MSHDDELPTFGAVADLEDRLHALDEWVLQRSLVVPVYQAIAEQQMLFQSGVLDPALLEPLLQARRQRFERFRTACASMTLDPSQPSMFGDANVR